MKKKIKYIILFLTLLYPSSGNFQILNIPTNTRMLSLANSGQSLNYIVNSSNPAAVKTTETIFNLHSHLYPVDILYSKLEMVIPVKNAIYSFEYANLNYGEFKDGASDYLFNCSEFLFKGSAKTTLFNTMSAGGSIGYGINKIAQEFAHALFISLGIRSQMDSPYLGYGLSINNIGSIIKNFNNSEESLPQIITFSTFYKPKYFPGLLLIDINKEKNIKKLQFRMGLELSLGQYISLRLGNSSNTLELIDEYSSYLAGLTAGLGIQIKKWNIDIGFYNLETAGIISGVSIVYEK